MTMSLMRVSMFTLGLLALASSTASAAPATLTQVRKIQNKLSNKLIDVRFVNGVGIGAGARGKGFRLVVSLSQKSAASNKAIRALVAKKVPLKIQVIGTIRPEAL